MISSCILTPADPSLHGSYPASPVLRSAPTSRVSSPMYRTFRPFLGYRHPYQARKTRDLPGCVEHPFGHMPSSRTPAGLHAAGVGRLNPVRRTGQGLPGYRTGRHPRGFSKLYRFTCVTAYDLPVLRFTLPSPARSGAKTRLWTGCQPARVGFPPTGYSRLGLAHLHPRHLVGVQARGALVPKV